jgi:hypothetical protein
MCLVRAKEWVKGSPISVFRSQQLRTLGAEEPQVGVFHSVVELARFPANEISELVKLALRPFWAFAGSVKRIRIGIRVHIGDWYSGEKVAS